MGWHSSYLSRNLRNRLAFGVAVDGIAEPEHLDKPGGVHAGVHPLVRARFGFQEEIGAHGRTGFIDCDDPPWTICGHAVERFPENRFALAGDHAPRNSLLDALAIDFAVCLVDDA
ncbi:hypothetical protein [Leifsonia sp. NCR5]|uniref:hypothetical protein n=1 Tax=Leifsonia sp. NCR5 TaxID=1978342 RepID=UPI0015C4DF90|nr:hypothetical protein [Leifsonia sp. NCR5]